MVKGSLVAEKVRFELAELVTLVDVERPRASVVSTP
jgi:hypothetical protein